MYEAIRQTCKHNKQYEDDPLCPACVERNLDIIAMTPLPADNVQPPEYLDRS